VDWIAGLAGDGAANRRDALRRAYEAMHEHESALFRSLEDGLSALPHVRFYGAARGRPRTPTAAFTVEGTSPGELAQRLGREGVFVGDGDFYATTVCETLGLADCGGVVRAGVAPYTTDEDVERLVDGVARIAS
jgi:selenocysteine lyase/cysteine desulfurase